MSASAKAVLQTLESITRGDRRAAESLLPMLYGELRGLAGSLLSRLRPGQTLQATALVHEAFLKLVGDRDPGWQGRAHFFGAAARAMREILVDVARAKAAEKRGGAWRRVTLSDEVGGSDGPSVEILDVHEALRRLEREDSRKAEVVLLRYFGGLTLEEVAEVLGIATPTVERDWRFARAWLLAEIDRCRANPDAAG